SPSNTCTTDTLSSYSNGSFPFDVPDPIANFMDYGNSACSNQFTQVQADRMRAAIITQRSGLLIDECTKPCIENIVAGFTRDIADPIIGDLINFTNSSTGTSNYLWLVDGVVVSSSLDLSYTFSATGKYKVTLKAYNSDINCFASYTDFIIVRCGVTARFYTDKKTIASRIPNFIDSIKFTNTSVNAISYQWLMSNNMGMSEQVISTDPDITYVFPAPGSYRVRLIATNGSCIDTSEFYTVPVLEPTVDGAPFNVKIQCFQQDKIRVSFCIANLGYESLPANTPVSFYDADPRLPGANKLSPDFYIPNTLPGICSNCHTQVLDTAYRGVEKIYIVVNDSGTTSPLVFPNTPVQEINYFNNLASVVTNRTTVNVAICQGSSYRGYTSAGTFIDTLTSVTGCDSLVTTNLSINPPPVPNLGADRNLCFGDTLNLDPGSFTSYIWQDGSTNANYATSKVGTYSVTVSNGLGCTASDTIKLMKIFPRPGKFLPPDSIICDGYTLQLKIPGYNNYSWNTGNNSYSIDITQAGVYALQVTDKNGCAGTDSMTVDVMDCIPIQIPSAFTPNRDGKNETFKPLIPVTVTNYHMQIFNRWGERVFETRNHYQGWDGMLASVLQPPDVYVYLIVFIGPDGINYKRSGTLALIR
ncbi:MAG: gliding motility-associated C-terminal domain-containing protein, partial [Chitinophagaceae bacterium]